MGEPRIPNGIGSLDDLFASKSRKTTSACRLCGNEVEANLTVEVRERKNGKPGRRISRSLAVCGPCAVGRFESLVEVLERA